jgi:hypothetical protein
METTSKIRKVRSLPRQGKGCSRDKETAAKASPCRVSGNGFLRHRFQPLTDIPAEFIQMRKVVEREFFISLSNLATTYGFEPLDVAGRIFPDNIRCAYHDAAAKVKAFREDLTLFILQDETHNGCLATAKPCSMGPTLFYIPVRPLCDVLADKDKTQVAGLLLSIFSYLYTVVKIPYYRDNCTYLNGTYAMMEEWLTEGADEWDEEEYKKQVANFELLYQYGDEVQKEISKPIHLTLFEERLKEFESANEKDEKLRAASCKCFNLYRDYPQDTVFDNIRDGIIQPQEEERIYTEQLVSFFWDYEDSLYESLLETVNCEFQEKGITEEPLALQLFDYPQQAISPHKLGFEERLFELISTLNDAL